MDGVLNEAANTVHKQEVGKQTLESPCGATNNLSKDQLRQAAVDQLVSTTTTTKCGRCFDDGGGY
jgi:hypothetical protein